jgi:hypothetical protein
MSDTAIEAKFKANAVPTVGETRASEIAAAVWALDELANANALLELCA